MFKFRNLFFLTSLSLIATALLPLGIAPALATEPARTSTGSTNTVEITEHSHLNWVFTKPGNYSALINMAFQIDNKPVSTSAYINFQAGAAGTTTSGHYDVMPVLNNSTYGVRIFDDNHSGTYKEPNTIWFGLDQNAKKTLGNPYCQAFNLTSPCTVWVSPQSQEANIPWVGFSPGNSELRKRLTSPVTITLQSLAGPGAMYAYVQNNFSGGVDDLWFAAEGDGSGRFPQPEAVPNPAASIVDPASVPAPVAAPVPASTQPGTAIQPGAAAQPGAEPESGTATQPRPAVPAPPAPPVAAPATPEASASSNNNAGAIAAPRVNSKNPNATVNSSVKQRIICRPVQLAPIQATSKPQRVALNSNTHVHPNWVFTEPGVYRVGIRQSVRIGGQVHSADTVLNFRVGSPGTANQGHFDLGVKVSQGKLVATLRDDRTPGGIWVDPSSLVFGLGSQATTTLPAGLETIAPTGTKVWMIGSTQMPGVPWLGANTQHPTLLEASSEPVTWEVTSFSGPGPHAKLGVFTSGNFGKLVGQHWFTLPANTAAVNNPVRWVTPDGKNCTPTAQDLAKFKGSANPNSESVLAITGVSDLVFPIIIAACGLILLGVGLRSNARVKD